ncbi:WXG100 family type VII secretion target [Actinoplanes sp. NPDC049265]|uniref:WXG100 family type VII secretion target n=1 Tax=Actinoplanes sp. NPDC049265 TaxID=3363902 RepID=UPI003721FA3A
MAGEWLDGVTESMDRGALGAATASERLTAHRLAVVQAAEDLLATWRGDLAPAKFQAVVHAFDEGMTRLAGGAERMGHAVRFSSGRYVDAEDASGSGMAQVLGFSDLTTTNPASAV